MSHQIFCLIKSCLESESCPYVIKDAEASDCRLVWVQQTGGWHHITTRADCYICFSINRLVRLDVRAIQKTINILALIVNSRMTFTTLLSDSKHPQRWQISNCLLLGGLETRQQKMWWVGCYRRALCRYHRHRGFQKGQDWPACILWLAVQQMKSTLSVFSCFFTHSKLFLIHRHVCFALQSRFSESGIPFAIPSDSQSFKVSPPPATHIPIFPAVHAHIFQFGIRT